MNFEEQVQEDWLSAFLAYTKHGEVPERIMRWVGVSTLAAVLGRKVWFDQKDYLWTPNFYILLVGEQGLVRKSTSIDIGIDLLSDLEDVKVGADATTWPAFVEDVEQAYREYALADGEVLGTSCVTLPLSEFGTFFDPEDRNMVDGLTSMWDGRKRFTKRTKTVTSNDIIKPWVNIIAGTTPAWIAKHMSSDTLNGGLISRIIFLRGEMPTKDRLYPERERQRLGIDFSVQRCVLKRRLAEISQWGGEVHLTEDAYLWTQEWYEKLRAHIRTMPMGTLEVGLLSRFHVHLHKLAMVIAASRGTLPTITVEHMQTALAWLQDVEEDVKRVLGVIGQSKLTNAAREIVTAVERAGSSGIERRMLYRKQFFRSMTSDEFNIAITCAVQAELIIEVGDITKPLLIAKSAFS